MPLVAAVVIGAIVLGLFAAIVPATIGRRDSGPAVKLDLTPGGQESQMRARLQQNPNDVNAMIVLADLLANSGRIDEAATYYERAVQARPDDEQLRLAFGTALLHGSDFADAEGQLLKAQQLAPNDPQPDYLLGQLYEAWQPPRTDDAVKLYRATVALDPTSVYAQRARDRLAALGQP